MGAALHKPQHHPNGDLAQLASHRDRSIRVQGAHIVSTPRPLLQPPNKSQLVGVQAARSGPHRPRPLAQHVH